MTIRHAVDSRCMSRGSFVALGAALHNARIAAAHRNILGATEVSGDGTATIARIAFTTGTDPQLAAQLPGMLNRVTHRGAPDTDPTSTNLTELNDLAAQLSTETHRIHLIEDRDTIDRLAETISATDRIRFLTDRLHREMIAELRWPDSNDLETGIEVTSLGTPAAELAVLELLRRPDAMTHLNRWNTGHALRSETTSRLTSSNAIAVITQIGTSAGDYIRRPRRRRRSVRRRRKRSVWGPRRVGDMPAYISQDRAWLCQLRANKRCHRQGC